MLVDHCYGAGQFLVLSLLLMNSNYSYIQDGGHSFLLYTSVAFESWLLWANFSLNIQATLGGGGGEHTFVYAGLTS